MILYKVALILHFYHGVISSGTAQEIDETIETIDEKSLCYEQKCPRKGLVGDGCRCLCKGTNEQTPIIDCFTKQPIGGPARLVKRPKPTSTKFPRDVHPSCLRWVRTKQCSFNPGWISELCRRSCFTVKKFKYRKCHTFRCPGKGFVGSGCRCFCKGPNEWAPVIDCFTKQPIGGRARLPTMPRLTATKIARDLHPSCPKWARTKQCSFNPGWISKLCRRSCFTVKKFKYRQCYTFRCPGKGFVGDGCRCFCKGPNEQTPIIDCFTKQPIGGRA